jgi:hypothetical protein
MQPQKAQPVMCVHVKQASMSAQEDEFLVGRAARIRARRSGLLLTFLDDSKHLSCKLEHILALLLCCVPCR